MRVVLFGGLNTQEGEAVAMTAAGNGTGALAASRSRLAHSPIAVFAPPALSLLLVIAIVRFACSRRARPRHLRDGISTPLNVQRAIFGIDFAWAPAWVHGAVCSGGVFASFVLHDFLQEVITKDTAGTLPLLMTSFEFGACSLLPALQLVVAQGPRGFVAPKGVAMWPVAAIAACLLASLSLGNVALRYVSYPLKVVLKSSKILPAMLMGVAMLGKRYLWPHYAAALMLSAGVIGCTAADKWVEGGRPSSAMGVCLLLVAVCCDAVSPVLQERLLGGEQLSPAQLMLRTNLLALLGTLAAWILTGEHAALAALPAAEPAHLLLALGAFGCSSFAGVTFMLALIEVWGSAVGVAVGTLRKVLTIWLSFFWWSKPFSATFAVSGLAVLLALALNAAAKRLALTQICRCLSRERPEFIPAT